MATGKPPPTEQEASSAPAATRTIPQWRTEPNTPAPAVRPLPPAGPATAPQASRPVQGDKVTPAPAVRPPPPVGPTTAPQASGSGQGDKVTPTSAAAGTLPPRTDSRTPSGSATKPNPPNPPLTGAAIKLLTDRAEVTEKQTPLVSPGKASEGAVGVKSEAMGRVQSALQQAAASTSNTPAAAPATPAATTSTAAPPSRPQSASTGPAAGSTPELEVEHIDLRTDPVPPPQRASLEPAPTEVSTVHSGAVHPTSTVSAPQQVQSQMQSPKPPVPSAQPVRLQRPQFGQPAKLQQGGLHPPLLQRSNSQQQKQGPQEQLNTQPPQVLKLRNEPSNSPKQHQQQVVPQDVGRQQLIQHQLQRVYQPQHSIHQSPSALTQTSHEQHQPSTIANYVAQFESQTHMNVMKEVSQRQAQANLNQSGNTSPSVTGQGSPVLHQHIQTSPQNGTPQGSASNHTLYVPFPTAGQLDTSLSATQVRQQSNAVLKAAGSTLQGKLELMFSDVASQFAATMTTAKNNAVNTMNEHITAAFGETAGVASQVISQACDMIDKKRAELEASNMKVQQLHQTCTTIHSAYDVLLKQHAQLETAFKSKTAENLNIITRANNAVAEMRTKVEKEKEELRKLLADMEAQVLQRTKAFQEQQEIHVKVLEQRQELHTKEMEEQRVKMEKEMDIKIKESDDAKAIVEKELAEIKAEKEELAQEIKKSKICSEAAAAAARQTAARVKELEKLRTDEMNAARQQRKEDDEKVNDARMEQQVAVEEVARLKRAQAAKLAEINEEKAKLEEKLKSIPKSSDDIIRAKVDLRLAFEKVELLKQSNGELEDEKSELKRQLQVVMSGDETKLLKEAEESKSLRADVAKLQAEKGAAVAKHKEEVERLQKRVARAEAAAKRAREARSTAAQRSSPPDQDGTSRTLDQTKTEMFHLREALNGIVDAAAKVQEKGGFEIRGLPLNTRKLDVEKCKGVEDLLRIVFNAAVNGNQRGTKRLSMDIEDRPNKRRGSADMPPPISRADMLQWIKEQRWRRVFKKENDSKILCRMCKAQYGLVHGSHAVENGPKEVRDKWHFDAKTSYEVMEEHVLEEHHDLVAKLISRTDGRSSTPSVRGGSVAI